MSTAPPQLAAAARDALAAFSPDDPAPAHARAICTALLTGTPFATWPASDPPLTTRELRIALGQIAAAHPRGGLDLALEHLADDCRDAGPRPCPGHITAVYTHLTTLIPAHGPAQPLRDYLRQPPPNTTTLADIALLATLAAPLAHPDDTPQPATTERAV